MKRQCPLIAQGNKENGSSSIPLFPATVSSCLFADRGEKLDRLNYGTREMLNIFNNVKVKELTSISLVSSILCSCSSVSSVPDTSINGSNQGCVLYCEISWTSVTWNSFQSSTNHNIVPTWLVERPFQKPLWWHAQISNVLVLNHVILGKN